MLDCKSLVVLDICAYNCKDQITLDVGNQDLIFPWKHCTPTPVHFFKMGEPMCQELDEF